MNGWRIRLGISSCSLALLLSGCAAFEGTTGSSTNAAETQYQYLEERLRTLTEKVAALEQNTQRELGDIQTRLAQLQSGASGQASAAELQQLRAQIQQLQEQQARDKQVILDQLAKEISGLASRRSAPPPPPTGAGAELGYEHLVQRGQTLTDISKAYGVSVAAIKKANNLTSDNIRVGQKLFIPKK